jgi:serine/threonine protein kinase
MNKHTLLNERYEIKEVLGRGGFATKYLAVDTKTQQQCAIKCLSFRKIKEWKTLELFEREARVLKNLDHPQIPNYIDFFTIETEHDVEIYLVQEYVEGKSLAQFVREGKHFTEKEVIKIALGITRILEYLHGFSPPIIHCDIKPNNIILNQYNRAFLIDFGAVREKIYDDLQPSGGVPTIVGTFGYMSSEQAEGRAVPASDIYSLGMTLIHVLSHKDPSQMEKYGLRLDFRPHVNVSRGFAKILERMIEPDWQQRYQLASDLRCDLEKLFSGKRPVKISESKLLRSVVTAVTAGILLFFVGFGVYLFRSYSPAPVSQETVTPPVLTTPPVPKVSPTPVPQKIVTPFRSTPVTLQVSPTPVPPTPVPTTVPTPKPPKPHEAIIYPRSGKINVNIYQDFTFKPTGWPFGLSVGQTMAGGLDTLPYERLIREPEYHSRQVLYGYFQLGNGDDRQISFVVDERDRPTWVVYVDANNNEDLTDDGFSYHNEGTGKFAANITVQIEIVTRTGAKMIQPYMLWMWVNESQNRAYFYATCHYAGKISFNEKEVYEAVAFEQHHHDGLYRESGLWIDLNYDQKLDEKTEHFEDGTTIHLNQTQYQLELQYP